MTAAAKLHHFTLSVATPKPRKSELTLSTQVHFGLSTDLFPPGLLVTIIRAVRFSPILVKFPAHLNLCNLKISIMLLVIYSINIIPVFLN